MKQPITYIVSLEKAHWKIAGTYCLQEKYFSYTLMEKALVGILGKDNLCEEKTLTSCSVFVKRQFMKENPELAKGTK